MSQAPKAVRIPVRAPICDGLAMPAEWAPHERCWMAWPCLADIWPEPERTEEIFAQVAQAIARFEPVTMLANPEQVEHAKALCGSGVEVRPFALDDSWTRDTGPTFVQDAQGRVAGVDWVFTGWAHTYTERPIDETVAQRMLEMLDMRRYAAPFILEGGSIHVDGEGSLLVTEQCLFDPKRNAIFTREEYEELFAAYLGVKKTIWLGDGLEDDDTHGHVDIVSCFARPGVVLLHACHDPADANHAVYKDNRRRLELATDAQGRKLEIVELPQPRTRFRSTGERMDLSYVNFYIANGGVVASSFGDPEDEEARATLARVFPDREVVQIPSLPIFAGGGGIHCITQQQPVGSGLKRF